MNTVLTLPGERLAVPELPVRPSAGGREYCLPNGEWVPSVTSFLSAALPPSPSLTKWIAEVGPAYAAQRCARGARRGTAIHHLLEHRYRGGPKPDAPSPLHLDLFRQVTTVLDQHITAVYGVEVPLWAAPLRLAGRSDFLGEWTSIPSVLDLKTATGSRVYPDDLKKHFLQAAAYAHLFHWLAKGRVKIRQLVVVVAHEAGPPASVFVEPARPHLTAFLDLWKTHRGINN